MIRSLTIALVATAFTASAAFAAPKGYQVTGPVEEVTDSKIIVKKGSEKWEIARDASTKAEGEIKKGDKVTVYYAMTATEIESKDAKKSDQKADAAKAKEAAPAAGAAMEKAPADKTKK